MRGATLDVVHTFVGSTVLLREVWPSLGTASCQQCDALHHSPLQAELTAELLAKEVHRRRNFAIISHPDAGKVGRAREAGQH